MSFMDSTLTLVNLPQPTFYFLSSTDLTDAVIYSQPGIPLYKITSDSKHIKIYDSDSTNTNHVVAILHRRDIFPDTISFPRRGANNPTDPWVHMSIQRWLKRSKLPDGTTMFKVDTPDGPYVWKSISRYRQKVFAEHDLEKPVALCNLHQSLSPSKPAFIIQPTGEPLRDDIVVAYLVQRHRVMLELKALDLFVGPS